MTRNSQISRGVQPQPDPNNRANAPEPTSPRGSGAQISEKQKLSVIPRGAWRNKWTSERPVVRYCPKTKAYIDTVGPGEFFSRSDYPSAEIAEQRALENMAANTAGVARKRIRYLGPVFFPDP